MNTNIPLVPEHINDERLIAFLDAEMDDSSRREAQNHLDTCWDCRIRLTNVERCIENFFEFRKGELLPSPTDIPPTGPAQNLLRAQLSAYQSLTPAQALMRGHIPGLGSLSRRITRLFNVRAYSLRTQVIMARSLAALLMVSIVVSFILMSGRLTTVSATELLDRSIDAQAAAIKEIPQPVLHQRILVRTGSDSDRVSVPLEIWNDTVNSRVRLSESGASIADLKKVLTANRMNAHRPLSAASYKSWTDSLSAKTEGVVISGTTLTVKTVPAQTTNNNQITEARFSVRASDYHPTALYIKTAEHEFELIEQTYEVVSLRDVDPTIFADPTKVELASTIGTKSEPRAVATGALPEDTNIGIANINAAALPNTPKATSADEVEVLDLLNNAGAFTGEQIDISRTAVGKLQVKALVETDKRKGELLAALSPVRNNPAVLIHIETVAEAQARELRSKKNSGQTQTAVTVDQFTAAESPVFKELRKRLSETEAQAFADRVVRRGVQARRHALALRQLSERFSENDLATLSSADRSRWLGLLRGHAAKFLSETEALRRELQTVFTDIGADVGGRTLNTDKEIQTAIRELYGLAVSCDEDVRASFASFTNARASAEVKTARFWRAINTASAIARAVQAAR